MNKLSRRLFLKQTIRAAALVSAVSSTGLPVSAAQNLDVADDPPIRTITSGPRHHWFGYYDKLQVDPSGRYVLGMEVDFEHRSPRPTDVIKIGMVDLADDDRWIEIGSSSAWCWQQGCMLQWAPGSANQILWNDRQGDGYMTRIYDLSTRKMRTIPHSFYALSPDGRTAISTDFRRLNDVRPGYGYAGIPDPFADQSRPDDSGIYRVDFVSGDQKLVLSIAEVAAFGTQTDDMKNAKHWFNHLLYSPDGSRFIFLHRWRPQGVMGSFKTRMLTAGADGKRLHVLDPSGYTSHFIWRDQESVLAWTRPAGRRDGFFLFRDRSDEVEQVGRGVMAVNGHCTYLPGNEWILNDTYPDRTRLQHVYLYHVNTGRRVPLGSFHSPPAYTGEWRCDTHPRFSPNGRSVIIDSSHNGSGRQMHVIDISRIVG
jgi:hypothetical protein